LLRPDGGLPGVTAKSRRDASPEPRIRDRSLPDRLQMELNILKRLRSEHVITLIEIMDDPNVDSLYLGVHKVVMAYECSV
jgi:hypothetical protein